jgi:hypothetical protein
MRMILMQDRVRMQELFMRLREIGVHYMMPLPLGLREDYWAVLAGCDLANL